MNTQVHILQASGKLAPFKEVLQDAAGEVIDQVERVLDVPKVDIVIVDNAEGAISEIGVGGSTYNEYFLMVSIDPEFPFTKQGLGKEIKSTIAHELHHCARMNALGYSKNLLDALMAEGLADHFDIEITGSKTSLWSTALDSDQMEVFFKKARAEFESEKYNHFDWFFGSEERKIPKWTGYALGFKLVGDYLSRTGRKSSELVGVSSKEMCIL